MKCPNCRSDNTRILPTINSCIACDLYYCNECEIKGYWNRDIGYIKIFDTIVQQNNINCNIIMYRIIDIKNKIPINTLIRIIISSAEINLMYEFTETICRSPGFDKPELPIKITRGLKINLMLTYRPFYESYLELLKLVFKEE